MEDFERQLLDQKLTDALARKQEPPSFEAKVFAAIAAGKSARRTSWGWETLAASLLLAAGLWAQHQQAVRERTAGEAAKARLQVALRITVTQLSKIQRSVKAATEDE